MLLVRVDHYGHYKPSTTSTTQEQWVFKKIPTRSIDAETFLSAFRNAKSKRKKNFDLYGFKFRTTTHSHLLFAEQGCVCVRCGIEGIMFIIETEYKGKRPHATLYALDENGNVRLMTKDHIIPKSRGGINRRSNYQVMCQKCNNAKADKVEAEVSHVLVELMASSTTRHLRKLGLA